MPWDKEVFLKNIDHLVKTKCGGSQKEFNRRVGPRDAATRWKKNKPTVEYIIKICEEFNCSIDWLLMGKEPGGQFCGWDPDTIELCKKLKEIIESETEFGTALEANVKAFHKAVDIDRRLVRLENLHDRDVHTGRGKGG